MSNRARILTIIVAVMLVQAAAAQVDYLPLAQGNTWTYIAANGEHETRVITGQTTVFGQDAWIMEYPGSPWNDVLDQYWSAAGNGDVHFHGFWREDWGRVYDPPLMVVDTPLELGQTWSTTVDSYTLPDLVYDSTFTIYYEVLEAGTYDVPAGSFEAFGVGTVEPPVVEKDGQRYSVLGELIVPDQRTSADWWSLGVGAVQYLHVEMLQLESYQIGTVAVQDQTWSGVKSLFD